ncbi:hypothetical protein QBC46DRAFT_397584 [Diplogelasinospora grovesii]|uniref:NB-ARC domain-containing protein n=1 Tax=Diplogelasinospora grovesii TaxID=303347 RepID=A0AAN6MYR4_9PEZI|nr:hypothetical protein QBC46DRAFT_397584 [Diplogelasinospora grovesii]
MPSPATPLIKSTTFVLHGLGGIGKIQLAVDFTRRHKATFSAIFWLDGRSEDLLRYSMIKARESVRGSHMMHPVVHRWASHIQDGGAKREVLRLAVMVVGLSVTGSTSKDYWVLQRRLLPHAERCSWWIEEIYGVG